MDDRGPPAATPAAPDPVPTRPRRPALAILGLALLATSGATVLVSCFPETGPRPVLGVISAGLGLAGAWADLACRRTWVAVLIGLAGLALGVGCWGLQWYVPAAWIGSVGAGALCAWGYAHRSRAVLFSAGLLAIAYAVIATGTILQVLRGHGHLGVITQGLSSLAVASICWWLSRRSLAAGAARPLRLTASVLLGGGIVLPYLALAAWAWSKAGQTL